MLISNKTVCGVPVSKLTKASEKRVIVKCEDCEKKREVIWHNYKLSQVRRNNSGETPCRTCSSKRNSQNRKKFIPWNKGKKGVMPSGKDHPTWKGGEYITSDGYKNIWIGNRRYKKEHVLVMEKALGRELKQNETVHHINGDKLNNEMSNLHLVDHKKHRDAHQTLQEIGYKLVKSGLVNFDKNNNCYVAHDKLRELLETPEMDNQQPSDGGDAVEGSTTSSETHEVNNSTTSAGRK